MTHYENEAPDVRAVPIVRFVGKDQRRVVDVAIGIYPDGDPEAGSIMTLSDAAAQAFAVQLLANANAMSVDEVCLSLEVGGFPSPTGGW